VRIPSTGSPALCRLGASERPPSEPAARADASSSVPSAAVPAFVQQFYTWYAPIANGKHRGPAWYGMCEKAWSAKPALVTEVARRDTSWVFVDFHYPRSRSGHLLGILSGSRQ
jgi:hypothetical protein